ncbi:prepilin peptidase [Verminephrobacter aporrectodeae]|uniref:prepilin peptidase n=1 Tax=Verminephrobacter aporrectodeae TaxID=1110389 RepID=UPI0034DAD341
MDSSAASSSRCTCRSSNWVRSCDGAGCLVGPGPRGVLGLLFGSFLNVVIYRLPKMMERQWAAERAALAWDTPNHGEAPPPLRRRFST